MSKIHCAYCKKPLEGSRFRYVFDKQNGVWYHTECWEKHGLELLNCIERKEGSEPKNAELQP